MLVRPLLALALAAGSLLASAATPPAPRGKYQAPVMLSLDPAQAETIPDDRTPQLERQPDGQWTWTLRTDENSSRLVFDLDRLGINPNFYDEIHFTFHNRNSLIMLAVELLDFPETDLRRNWYSKIAIGENSPHDWRLDLNMDDDGLSLGPRRSEGRRQLTVTLHKRFLRNQGELPTRQITFSGLRLIRRPVTLGADPFQSVCFQSVCRAVAGGTSLWQWEYRLQLENRESRPVNVTLRSHAEKLRHFAADWQEQNLTLAPRERRAVPLLLTLKPGTPALPVLYSERILPGLRLNDWPELPELHPLLGYRPSFLYATLPPAKAPNLMPTLTPEEQAKTLAEAEAELHRPFAIPEYAIPIHPQQYYDKEANSALTPLSWFRHRSQKSGAIIEFDAHINAGHIGYIHTRNFERILLLGKAYRISGDFALAEAARDRLLEYARSYTTLHRPGTSASTGYLTRLGASTLMTSYSFYKASDAYALIRESACLSAADRQQIEEDFLLPEMRGLYLHNIEFTNMQVEHFRTYARAAAGLNRCWNLLGEALHGDHGYFQIIEKSFSDDGYSHEGAAYHRSIMGPLMEFSAQMREMGMEVMNQRFKRVFDGYILNAPDGITTEPAQLAELRTAYQVYGDPRYLPSLRQAGLSQAEGGEPLRVSTLAENRGFIWLREESPAGFRALSLNYLMIRDRGERDRLHVNFYDPQPLNGEMGRIIYSSPQAKLMEETFGHNCITVDRELQADLPARLALFLDRPLLPAALVTEDPDAPLYPGMRFARAVALCEGLFVVADIFQSLGQAEHAFDAPFYSFWQPGYRHDNGAILVAGQMAEETADTGYPLLQEVRSCQPQGVLAFLSGIPAWNAKTRRHLHTNPSDRYLRVTLLTPPASTFYTANIPRGYRPEPGPLAFLRQHGTGAVFARVAEVVGQRDATGRVRDIRFEPLPQVQDGCSGVWTIRSNDASYRLLINRSGQTVTLDHYTGNDLLHLEKLP